jgi:hypothetical protein
MHPTLSLLIALLSIGHIHAQLNFSLAYDITHSLPVRINKEDSVSVLRFYISDVHIEDGKKIIWKAEKQHYLIDFNRARLQSNIITGPNLENIKNGRLKFTLGIDKNTASQGIGEGPLDPIQGMYWTWQSGYINFKFEGVSSQCPSRKNRFQMHLGGFQKPFRSAQSVELQIRETNTQVVFNLNKFMSKINLKEEHTIMSPNEKAVSLMKLAKSCFYVQ